MGWKRLDRATIFWAVAGAILFLFLLYSVMASRVAKGEVVLTIYFGQGSSRTFKSEFHSGVTAWDLLQQANANYHIFLEAEAGFWPRTIGDFTNGTDGKKWNFYINYKRQSQSPLEADLSGGDTILFKFE